jgi:hypothetical protein
MSVFQSEPIYKKFAAMKGLPHEAINVRKGVYTKERNFPCSARQPVSHSFEKMDEHVSRCGNQIP